MAIFFAADLRAPVFFTALRAAGFLAVAFFAADFFVAAFFVADFFVADFVALFAAFFAAFFAFFAVAMAPPRPGPTTGYHAPHSARVSTQRSGAIRLSTKTAGSRGSASTANAMP